MKLLSNSVKNINLVLMTVMFTLNKKCFLDELSYFILEKELKTNEQLRKNLTIEQKKKKLFEFRKLNLRQRKIFIKELGMSFLFITIAVVLGAIISGGRIYLNKFIGILSLFCFSWATLGRLGWKAKTWAGDTPVEVLDNVIFWLLYFLGSFLGVISIRGG